MTTNDKVDQSGADDLLKFLDWFTRDFPPATREVAKANLLHDMKTDCANLSAIRSWEGWQAALQAQPSAPAKINELLSHGDEFNWAGTNIKAVLYIDMINDKQVCRDDLWLATTDDLKKLSTPADMPASDAATLTDTERTELETYRRVLAGLPDGAIDGGWTAAGICAHAAKLEKHIVMLDRSETQTITDRDCYQEWADKLADAIAKLTGVDVGEHSSANNPWRAALEAMDEYAAAPKECAIDPRFSVAHYEHDLKIDPLLRAMIDDGIIAQQPVAAIEPIGERVEIGIAETTGVRWFNKNPHAHPVGTRFYASTTVMQDEVKPS